MFFRRKKSKQNDDSEQITEQDGVIEDALSDSESDKGADVSGENRDELVVEQSGDMSIDERAEDLEIASADQSSTVTDESFVADDADDFDDKVEMPQEKLSILGRIKRGLSRTSQQLSISLGRLLLGKKIINDELLEDIEALLLTADVGMEATTDIIDDLTDRVARKQLSDSGALYEALKVALSELLKGVEAPLIIDTSAQPYVILVVGVNGVGKTTTIGKLTKRFQNEGLSVMLAAGDTFRAAAVEQLQVWGQRNQVPVVAQHTGADSASVIYDAIESAKSKKIDVLIADTAGRLHNKSHLMDELHKVRRVIGRLDGNAPHEVMLVLDAGTGQNAINQTKVFKETAGVTGLVLTKLDGTAKGGVIYALSKKYEIPVRFIGVGEGVDDLQPFDAEAFTEALFGEQAEG
ncbi:MAG: signal recognition particle-docking protein FtsY [Alteromonadaceae bacterium]|nr:MAG: signal recognition particle-docking protein FtsY [Alteromonadaceae bacterium]